MEARYLNVDCILRSKHSLTELLSYLDNEIFILWNDSDTDINSIGFETKLLNTKSPEEDISKFLSLFESLPPALSKLLKTCDEKILDIGFESGDQGAPMEACLDSLMLARISSLGFNVGMRIYPQGPDSEVSPQPA